MHKRLILVIYTINFTIVLKHIKLYLFLFFFLKTNLLLSQIDSIKVDINSSKPKYETVLNYIELSILNSAMIDGISKYKGNIELETNAQYMDNQVLWKISAKDKAVFEVLDLYVAQKSMEFLKTINIENATPVEKITISSLSTLSKKIEVALKNPVWESRTLSGLLTNEGAFYYISTNANKIELAGSLHIGLKSWTGKKIVVTGLIKEPGKIEMTSIRLKKEKTLELFIMSQCPFGVEALKYVFDKQDEFAAKNRINFEVHYIFTKKDSNYLSLHGEHEIIENIVQIIIRDKYSHFYIDYLKQRISYPSEPWQQLAKKVNINAKTIEMINYEITNNRDSVIQREFSYMMENFRQINSSPTYIWNSEIINSLEEIPGFQGGISGEIGKCKH
jgi:hypothetical protein